MPEIDLNLFAEQVHINAIAHGWWDEAYTPAVALDLIASEVFEAFAAWRNFEPMVYELDGKPEGIANELADVALRILDTSAAWGVDLLPFEHDEYFIETFKDYELPKLVIDFIFSIAETIPFVIRDGIDTPNTQDKLSIIFSCMLNMIYYYLYARNYSLIELMQRKHKYNLTRPFKHGGKRV